jgi:hypothetical protein
VESIHNVTVAAGREAVLFSFFLYHQWQILINLILLFLLQKVLSCVVANLTKYKGNHPFSSLYAWNNHYTLLFPESNTLNLKWDILTPFVCCVVFMRQKIIVIGFLLLWPIKTQHRPQTSFTYRITFFTNCKKNLTSSNHNYSMATLSVLFCIYEYTVRTFTSWNSWYAIHTHV